LLINNSAISLFDNIVSDYLIKMIKRFSVFLITFVGLHVIAPAQNQEAKIDKLQSHVYVLASDSLSGRFPGTAGDSLTFNYIKTQFSKSGQNNYGFQEFFIPLGIKAGKSNFIIQNGKKISINNEFGVYPYSANTNLESELYYCIDHSKLSSNKADTSAFVLEELSKLKSKWIIVDLRNSNNKTRHRDIAQNFADKGAGGLIFLSDGKNNDLADTITISPDQGKLSIPVVFVGGKLIDYILDLHLNNKKFNAQTEILSVKTNTYNVFSVVKGNNPNLNNEYILIGAHYDHLGLGGFGSNSRRPDTTAIHYGADDNASGVASMLELMRIVSLNKETISRSYIFVAFGAEERGLLGSKFFADGLRSSNDSIVAMINLDMIGRLKSDKSLQIGGTGTSVEADSLLKLINSDFDFRLVLSPEGYGPSDHASFYAKDIPVFFISSGAHSDYHTPADRPESINYLGLSLITDFVYNLILELDKMPKPLIFTEAGPKKSTEARHGGTRKVSFGIMPDFAATEINGLRAEIVSPGKPAFLAGMKNGDIIKSINGNTVNDIQEYMYRLGQLNEGEQVTVDIDRNGELLILIIQL
jgi:aminopeptidase YwaD